MSKRVLTVVTPVFNEEEVIRAFYERTRSALDKLDDHYEARILFVVDRCTDNTVDILKEIAALDSRAQVLTMSARFGHQMALLAGIDYAAKRMEKINAIINWPRIESLLLKHYAVGKSAAGADAYPPLLLLKFFLIQQWFHIDSDPELETQINDRISFKKFLGLSFDQLSPDHSTFSRFRNG